MQSPGIPFYYLLIASACIEWVQILNHQNNTLERLRCRPTAPPSLSRLSVLLCACGVGRSVFFARRALTPSGAADRPGSTLVCPAAAPPQPYGAACLRLRRPGWPSWRGDITHVCRQWACDCELCKCVSFKVIGPVINLLSAVKKSVIQRELQFR